MPKKEVIKKSTLASYAVMKALTDSNEYRNSYEILADFIRYIVVNRKWHEFSIVDISNELEAEFGFDNIPIPAIRTTLKQIKEFEKNGDNYVLPRGTYFKTEAFQRARQISVEQSQSITNQLFEFAKEHSDEVFLCDPLEGAFIKFILDDAATIDQKYSDIISKFIINNESSEKFKKQITQIREGSVLYSGLAYNISELGSIKSELTLFLDTEVLFNVAGYNGLLYQKMAEDFLKQVSFANSKKKRIHLRFFSDVKHEVEYFFRSAENIIRGKAGYITNTAMKSIINGCETVSDVRLKEADFFSNLKSMYGIIPDEKESYYTESDYSYNIEIIPDGYPNDHKSFEAVKFISHINKLRKGEKFEDYTKCKFLLVTETKRIQEISNTFRTNKNECGFALPTSAITNILWFKLGSGFSKREYPINTDASYKARRIISGEIASSIVQLFEDTKKQYDEGVLSQDQVAGRIVLMRDKICTPDEVAADNIEELLDFSPEYIAKYEDGVKQNKLQLQEKQAAIEILEAERDANKAKNERLTSDLARATEERDASKALADKHYNTIIEQKEELERLRTAENKRNAKVQWLKKMGLFILSITLLGVAFALAVYIVECIIEQLAPQVNRNVNLIVDIAGVVGFLYTGVKGVWTKIYGYKGTNRDES